MKYLIVLLFVFASCSKGQDLVAFPQEAMEDVFLTIDGKEQRFSTILDAHKGETLLIDVWASWCRDCIKGMPILKQLQKDNPDVTFLFLSLDRNEKGWKRGIKKYQLEGDHYFVSSGWKGAFGKAIDLDWIPRYMVVNKKGIITLFRAETLSDFRIQEFLTKG